MNFKSRVHVTTSLIDKEVPCDQLGSYAVFYFVGGLTKVTSYALGKPFNKKTLSEMYDAGIHIFVKAGTVRRRATTAQNSYKVRIKEIQSELGKLNAAKGKRPGLSTVTYLAYEKMMESQYNHCFMVMLPLSSYNPNRYDTHSVEGFVEDIVGTTYGLTVDNSHDTYTDRDRARWGTSSLKFTI